jgi:hypothetical protein
MTEIDTKNKIVVPLDTPIDGHEKIERVILRKPNAGDYRRLGEPAMAAMTSDKTTVLVENNEVISDYIELCLEYPANDLLNRATVHDFRKVKQAILDFFQLAGDAAPAGELS